MVELFAEQTLRELTLAHLDADPDSLRFERVHTGKHNRSFWVDTDSGRYVLRIAPPDNAGFLFYERRMMHQEPELHTLIRAHTHIPVAEIVAYDFSRVRIPRDYLFMRALPGRPLSEVRNVTRSQFNRALYQVGEYLAELHRLTAPDCLGSNAYGYLGTHRPMDPQPTWLQAFDVMWNKLLDDVVACGAYSPEEGQTFRDLLARHRLVQFTGGQLPQVAEVARPTDQPEGYIVDLGAVVHVRRRAGGHLHHLFVVVVPGQVAFV